MTVSSLFEESLSVPFAAVTGSSLVREVVYHEKKPLRSATNAYLANEVLMALFQFPQHLQPTSAANPRNPGLSRSTGLSSGQPNSGGSWSLTRSSFKTSTRRCLKTVRLCSHFIATMKWSNYLATVQFLVQEPCLCIFCIENVLLVSRVLINRISIGSHIHLIAWIGSGGGRVVAATV